VLDEHGGRVFGALGGEPSRTVDVPLAFFDPWSLGIPRVGTPKPPVWHVLVSGADDPGVKWAIRGANWTLLVIAVTAATLATGFVLMGRAIQAKASLANVRAVFVSAVTHELKTPLTSICMVADGMMRGDVDAATIRRYAGVLATESRGLSRLIDNILAYSRVTDVTDVYTFERICVAELIEDVLRGFDQKLSNGSFDVDVDIPSDLPPVRGDWTALRLAFDNLVDNAIRYSDTAHWIRISARQAGSRIQIDVSDHGVGIPASELEAVQRKFVRGSQARHAGTGLGLAIVQRVARDHGGQLTLLSTVGAGTTARLDLPAAEEI
jgi:signal transduction histidine kinase